jgi:hypothetical protein
LCDQNIRPFYSFVGTCQIPSCQTKYVLGMDLFARLSMPFTSPRKFLRLEEGGPLLRQPIGSLDGWRNGESRPIKNNFLTNFLLKELNEAFFSVSQYWTILSHFIVEVKITKHTFFHLYKLTLFFIGKLFQRPTKMLAKSRAFQKFHFLNWRHHINAQSISIFFSNFKETFTPILKL